MHKSRILFVVFCLSLVLFVSGCSPVQLFNPTITQTPTLTSIPTSTFTPTLTLTLTLTPTASLTPTPTEYVIDQVMFHNFPSSYDAFILNPNVYVKSPYNPIDSPVEFRQWMDNVLTPAIGDRDNREVNYYGHVGNDGAGWTFYADNLVSGKGELLHGEPEFFWLEWRDRKYPVPIFNIGCNNCVNSTIAIALSGNWGRLSGTDALKLLSEGKRVLSMRAVSTQEAIYPDFVNRVVRAGFVGQTTDGNLHFGAGGIKVTE
jgi:hypothetical protein